MITRFKILLILCCSLITVTNAQSDGDISGSSQMSESEISGMAEHWDEVGQAGDQLGDLAENFGDLLKAVQSAKDLYDAAKALDDNECIPDLTTDASAMMPTGCDEEENCSACYEKGVSRLNHVRKTLARMACLRINTKTYVESAIAFGDDVSGIHGAMGLIWQTQKIGIKKSYEKFKKTYGIVPDALTALGYDAVKVLVEAMKRTDNLDTTKIRNEIASTKNYQGVTGLITIDEKRNPVKSAVVLKVVSTGFKYQTTVNP